MGRPSQLVSEPLHGQMRLPSRPGRWRHPCDRAGCGACGGRQRGLSSRWPSRRTAPRPRHRARG
eukprot:2957298-Alexandrium_andersonii.AAC.1